MNTEELNALYKKIQDKEATEEEVSLFLRILNEATQEADKLLSELTQEN